MKKRNRNFGLFIKICSLILIVIILLLCNIQKSATYVFLLNGMEEQDGYIKSFKEKLRQDNEKTKLLGYSENSYVSLQQYQLLQNYVKKGTKCIVVDAATKSNLSELLSKYREQGIKIISTVNEVNEQQRNLHVGIVDPVKTGNKLMEKVYNLTNGEGDFIILCDSMQESMSNSLMMGIREKYEELNPKNLYLDDVLRMSEVKEVEKELEQYLKKNNMIILCLTKELTESVCEVVKSCKIENSVFIIGLSDKSWLEQNKDKLKSLRVLVYYYDDEKYGEYLAEIAEKITQEDISCVPGCRICLQDGFVCEITENINRTKEDSVGVETYLFQEWEQYEGDAFLSST